MTALSILKGYLTESDTSQVTRVKNYIVPALTVYGAYKMVSPGRTIRKEPSVAKSLVGLAVLYGAYKGTPLLVDAVKSYFSLHRKVGRIEENLSQVRRTQLENSSKLGRILILLNWNQVSLKRVEQTQQQHTHSFNEIQNCLQKHSASLGQITNTQGTHTTTLREQTEILSQLNASVERVAQRQAHQLTYLQCFMGVLVRHLKINRTPEQKPESEAMKYVVKWLASSK